MAVRISLSSYGSSALEKIIGHQPEVLDKWLQLEQQLFIQSSLDHNLLEQVRRSLAFGNGCEYCMAKAGRPDLSIEDNKIIAATEFAGVFVLNHEAISEKHFIMLKQYFTELEISALCVFIVFISASQQLGRIVNLTKEYQTNGNYSVQQLNEK